MIAPYFAASLAVLAQRAQERAPRDANLIFPVEASTVARGLDDVFYFILWVSIISFVIVIGAATVFVLRYRAREGHQAEKTPSHDMRLELTWTVIPTILVAVMFFFGFNGFMELRTAPRNSETVYVEAQMWNWSFRYANGAQSPELVVPLGRPVKLVMNSVDVLHSLYIPAFRVKQDVVPGRYTTLWFEAIREGTFHLFCTEYCGTNHSTMITSVRVLPEDAYQAELVEMADFVGRMPPLEAGERVFRMNGCAQCHNTTTATRAGGGPGLANLELGAARQFVDGSSAQVDEDYIRRSILRPNDQIVAGYTPIMTPYQGRISEPELAVLIQYLLSLHGGEGQ
jgi:cytochrome c oxidase subunit II